MKNLKLLFLAIFASVILSGCLQVDTKINLNKDGSGTIEETVLMKSSVIDMMKEFAVMFDSTKADNYEIFKEEEIKAKTSNFGEGVKYLSGEKVFIDGFEGFKALYSFEDINKINISSTPDNKIPFEDEFKNEEEKPVDKNFKFSYTKGNPSTLVINLPQPNVNDEIDIADDNDSKEDSSSTEDVMQKMIDMFDGMQFNVSLNFNKPIVETNASYVEGNKVTIMQVDFSEAIKNKDILEKLQKSKSESLKELKEIMGDLPGIKIETKDQITIKF